LAFHPEAQNQSSFILLYLLAVTKFTDAGAYVVGRVLGKHKMIPRISPGKTWEGFVGGLVASVSMSVLLPKLMPGGLKGFTLVDSLVLGILLSLASVVGDLAESLVKRDAHVKDSGHIIPGIGGVLDLIDSLLFTAPVFYFYVHFVVL
jgi:phosphatidate cytidylyltransferase